MTQRKALRTHRAMQRCTPTLSSATIWRRAYVGINEAPETAAGIRDQVCVHNNSNGQKYHIAPPCQVPHEKAPTARRGFSPLFSPYNQTSDAFWDVDICGVTTYGSNERTSDVNRV